MSASDAGPTVLRSEVEAKSSYQEYREELRLDFWFSCGYCSMAEIEATGIGFQIDHYLPRKTHPHLATTYSNLLWACAPCNRQKADFSPTTEDRQVGRVVLRPDEDDFREHLELYASKVAGITMRGKWTVDLLNLNRQGLIRLRTLRERFGYARDLILNGLRELRRALIDHMPPGDRPEFLRLRDDLESAETDFQRGWSEHVREMLRSPLLDADPEAKKKAVRRRDQLRELRALMPDDMVND